MAKSEGRDLIIVESFAKTKTLAGFLGKGYEVRASLGHVRDLPKNKLGVDPEHGFRPTYHPIPERKDVIEELRRAARKARHVYLASDPDREGEAIAWHLSEVLGVPNAQRIEFNEITRSAVQAALQAPRSISMERVNAQQARRVLDRLVGYQISPLLWKKVAKNLSAGRVQSVALRMVVEREREIQRFVPSEYWSLTARLSPREKPFPFDAKLVQVDGRKAELAERGQVEAVLARLGYDLQPEETEGRWRAVERPGATPGFVVEEVRRKEQSRNPAPPFTTSTLQQEAARKLGFNARRTMSTAQQLYEGVALGEQGHTGLITYMRTDSVNVAEEAQQETAAFVSGRFGASYLPSAPRRYRSKKGAQEAHEAIRPTSVHRTPDQLRPYLEPDQFRLYQLIWQRFVASQMAAAVFDVTTVDIRAGELLFRATGRVVRFDGFTRVYTEGRDDRTAQEQEEDEEEGRSLPALEPGQPLDLQGLLPAQHFTDPPPRFTEATLVRALEEKGIGRPSTYAQILSTIVDRDYVVLEEKRFRPTELGCKVNDQLVKHFPEVVDENFTARIEQQLDDIAEGEREWVDVLRQFYNPFQEALARAEAEMQRPEAERTAVPCPKCGRPMVVRSSRYGRFLGCSGYPECSATIQEAPRQDELAELTRLAGPDEAARALQVYVEAPLPVVQQHGKLGVLAARVALSQRGAPLEEMASEPVHEPGTPTCPDCGREMQKRKGRFGEFWGCTGYPECKKILDPRKQNQAPPDPDFSMPCPREGCGGTVTAKRSFRGSVFYGCSNYTGPNKCDYIASARPDPDDRCEKCGFPKAERIYFGKSSGKKCTNRACSESGLGEKPSARGAARSAGPRRGTRPGTRSAGRSKK